MKVVDRKTFLEMPEGTVYCKIQFRDPKPGEYATSRNGWDSSFDIGDPHIKGSSLENDFICFGIGDFQAKEGDHNDVLQYICDHLGTDVPFELAASRDGLFDDTHVYFAIYSRYEIQQMISELQEALERAYNK